MTHDVRRLVIGALLGGGVLVAGLAAMPAEAQSCDPVYTSHCVPPLYATGDMDCECFYAQGIYGISLADP